MSSENIQNDAQSELDETKKKKKTSLFGRKFLLLSGFCALSTSALALGAYSLYDSSESDRIGRMVGQHYKKIQEERKAANIITAEASAHKNEYTAECQYIATQIYQHAQSNPQKKVPEIIDWACQQYLENHPNNPKNNVIIEDWQTMKQFFDGSNKDLMNVACYYHLSPEIPFFNRHNEPAEVRDGIYRYEMKARHFLRNKYNIDVKSMFDPSR